MSSKVLESGILRLTSEQDKLQLLVSTFARFRFPECSPAVEGDEAFKQLSSGQIWVSHGTHCHLNLCLTVNEKLAEGSKSFHLIEAIAYRLRNAPLWNQLSITAKVDIHHPISDELDSHISIALNHESQLPTCGPNSRLMPETEFRPPASVLAVEFEGLRICCDFVSIQDEPLEPKVTPKAPSNTTSLNDDNRNPPEESMTIPKPGTNLPDCSLRYLPCRSTLLSNPAPETPRPHGVIPEQPTTTRKGANLQPRTPLTHDVRPLDDPLGIQGSIGHLETAIAGLSKLSGSITEAFSMPQKRKSAVNSKRISKRSPNPFVKEEYSDESTLSFATQDPPLNYGPVDSLQESPTSKPVLKHSVKQQKPKSASTIATEQNHAIIKQWMDQNRENPYPMKDQMQVFLKGTGYSKRHLNWLIGKFRTSVLATIPKIEPRDGLFPRSPKISQPPRKIGHEDDMLLDENEDAPYDFQDDDMLLSPADNTLPWFDSEASPIPLPFPSSVVSQYYELESPESDHPICQLIPKIAIPTACQLSETALRFLIGGHQYRHRGIRATLKRPDTSLSRLVPSLFNAGFRQLMAQNAQFLPTISNAISSSWVKNKQGVGLRKKLTLIALLAQESAANKKEDVSVTGSAQKHGLEAAVQRRLWQMMHNKMYDARVVRNLRHTASDGFKNFPIFEDSENIFSGVEARSDSQESQATTYHEDGGGFDSLFDDRMEFDASGELHEAEPLNPIPSLAIGEDGEDDGFEDLFLLANKDDEGLISYLDEMEAERERREIERDTDEMLFGSSSPAGGDDRGTVTVGVRHGS